KEAGRAGPRRRAGPFFCTIAAHAVAAAAKMGGLPRSPRPIPAGAMTSFASETVLAVRHWTDDYFSFTTTRDGALRFENGQFVMLGIEVDGRPLMRAYSIASANWEEQLEFFSI